MNWRLKRDGLELVALSKAAVEGEAWQSLRRSCRNLPRDLYYTAGYRYRTLNHASAATERGWIPEFDDQPANYSQPASYNPDMGGRVRAYAFNDAVHRNSAVAALIAANLTLVASACEVRVFDLNIHVVRYRATPGCPVNNSPPGMHKDGERFISVHLIDRDGIVGGRSVVADATKQIFASFVLEASGSGFILDDDITWHQVEEMRCSPGSSAGYRDILLIDYLPRSPSSPPAA